MKLHLHLGAHKTATTHFQNVLETNRSFYPKDTNYVSMQSMRNHLVWGKNNTLVWHRSGNYLKSLLNTHHSVLIISEENISGETKDIFTHSSLYEKLEPRLTSLLEFISQFEEIEIWFSIRSMDSFLPSIYCESLKHFPYNRFNRVYQGHIEHSWVPVIQQIRNVLPCSRINILRYENYMEALPQVISCMFKSNESWNYLVDERPLSSLNHDAVTLLDKMRFVLPKRVPRKFVQNLSNKFDYFSGGTKFSPFCEREKEYLNNQYENDINIIRILENVILY